MNHDRPRIPPISVRLPAIGKLWGRSGSRCSARVPLWRVSWRWLFGFLLLWSCWTTSAAAGGLSDRIASFPEWSNKPAVDTASGDLVYPGWFAGTWELTSTLLEQVAPLAPEVVSPGFEGNRQFLNKPVTTQVRFVAAKALARGRAAIPLLSLPTTSLVKAQIVSDRAFNGLNLARAYLGDRVFRVWTDPRDSNRQITKFRDNRKLYSTVVGRAIEQPDADHFLTTELFDQFFQAGEKPYKNQVETTTAYARQPDGSIRADQITAVYLNPPHPKAYLAGDRPVALYRYRLDLRSDR